ncbi:MAG: hypothetical protein IT278_01015 [Ignavibacteriaceae bacterium]|nr:hypothetical protein [Ignavibacteriaceae bacterium]
MAEFKLKKEISIVTRQEQEVQDLEYWSKKSYSEKLDACFFLLQQYLDMHPDVPRRLQRVATLTYRKREQVD